MESENMSIDKICRGCLINCEQFKLLTENVEGLHSSNWTLADLLFDVTKIEVRIDNKLAPNKICLTCFKDLSSAYNFIIHTQRSNERLREYIQEIRKKQPDCLPEGAINIPSSSVSNQVENQIVPGASPIGRKSSISSSESERCDNDTMGVSEMKHINKMQCMYCSRVFKRLGFLESHQRKHEQQHLNKQKSKQVSENSLKLGDKVESNSDVDLQRAATCTNTRQNAMTTQKRLKKMMTECKPRKLDPISYRFECDSCGKTFARKKDLYRHEKRHESNTRRHSCPHCERRFIRKDKLRSHLIVHLSTKSHSSINDTHFAKRLFTAERIKSLKCTICNYDKVLRIDKLLAHIKEHGVLTSREFLMDSDYVRTFCPGKELDEVISLIENQIKEDQFSRFYSITNANGYELALTDSDESDPDTKSRYACELCKKSFNRKYKIMSHQLSRHTLDECPYKCEKCNMKFTSKRIQENHLRNHCNHPEKQLQCTKCSARFVWPNNFELHICNIENKITSGEIMCENCDRTFVRPEDLREHKKTHLLGHRSPARTGCDERFMHSERSQKEDSHMRKRITCMLCDSEFSSISQLRNHLKCHSDGYTAVNFENCSYVTNFHPDMDKSTISRSIRFCFEEQGLWQLYMTVNKYGFENVLSDSDSEDELQKPSKDAQLHICELCNQQFTRTQDIRHHQHAEHSRNKSHFPWICPRCADGFVCGTLLDRHIKHECPNMHRIHTCPKCGAKFMWIQNLTAHDCVPLLKVCKENKKCEVCGKQFAWLKDLTRHKRCHTPNGKKFECIVCRKKFNRKDNMRAHMKVHSPDYKFQAKTSLRWEHQDENLCLPHGEKIIQCKICLVELSTIRDLAAHLKTHSNPWTLKQIESKSREVSQLIYNKHMDFGELTEKLCADVENKQYGRLYSITNESGYELNLDDSETGTDCETCDDSTSGSLKANRDYTCTLCNKVFDRKFKIFEHQRSEHSWNELPLECKPCGAKFVSHYIHQLHVQNECKNIDKRFKCKRCPWKFIWKHNLEMHEQFTHDKDLLSEKKHECSLCGKHFVWHKDLLRHKKSHQLAEAKFECTWCFRIFLRRDNLKVHMKVHQNATHLLLPDIYYLARPNGVKLAECKHCEQTYSTLHELLQHLCVSHRNIALDADIPSPFSYSITNALGYEMDIEDSETENEQPLEKYACELCDCRFNRRFKVLQHQQAHHYSDNIPHKCAHCNFECVSEVILNYHINKQCLNSAKKFRCSKCTMRFTWQKNLENHESLTHENPRTHTCTTCKRNFVTMSDLQSHGECKQPAELKIFKCNLCDRKYNRKDRLIKHEKTHTSNSKEAQAKNCQSADKKFLCAFCGKEVSSSSNLVVHMRRHTGEKPFKCEFCNKGFPRSSDLSCHRRTHTGERPHKCTVCDKAFSRPYKLQTHMRIHSGERPYKCTFCGKSFTQSNDLTLHVRRHTGERPYTCDTCGERFIQGTALRNHRRMRGHYEI